MKIKRETPLHIEAFEYYYNLGDKRSYERTAEHFGVTKTTIQNWAESFKWQQRVEIRDSKINKELLKDGEKKALEKRAELIADIDAALIIFRDALQKNLKKISEKTLIPEDITQTKQYVDIANALEKIAKLRLLLTGEIEQKVITISLPEDIDI